MPAYRNVLPCQHIGVGIQLSNTYRMEINKTNNRLILPHTSIHTCTLPCMSALASMPSAQQKCMGSTVRHCACCALGTLLSGWLTTSLIHGKCPVQNGCVVFYLIHWQQQNQPQRHGTIKRFAGETVLEACMLAHW